MEVEGEERKDNTNQAYLATVVGLKPCNSKVEKHRQILLSIFLLHFFKTR